MTASADVARGLIDSTPDEVRMTSSGQTPHPGQNVNRDAINEFNYAVDPMFPKALGF